MKKLSYFLMLLAGCSIMFTSCIDNDESDSVKQMREAKASESEAAAAYLNAQAQAALILAQADADYTAALAQVEAAKASLIMAEAAYQEALTTLRMLEAQLLEGSLSAEIEAAILKAQADAAKYAEELAQAEYNLKQWENKLEVLALEHEAALLKAQLEYKQAMVALQAYLAEIKSGANEYVAELIAEYEKMMGDLAQAEFETVEKEIDIMRAEAALVYYTQTLAIEKESFIKDLESAVNSAENQLSNAREVLAAWEALFPDVEQAKAMIAEVEEQIESLKSLRIDAYNAMAAAESDRDAKQDIRNGYARAKADGFVYNYSVNGIWFVISNSQSYVSLANGETYEIKNTIEGVRSIIPLIKADIETLEQNYEEAVSSYDLAIAGIEDAVEADQQAYETYIAASEAWTAAWESYTNGDITKSAFLEIDEAYCIAYVEYFGQATIPGYGVISGVADGRQSRPDGTTDHNGTTMLQLGTLNGVYGNTTAYPGDPSDPDLIQALTDATTAWNSAYAAYNNWEMTADDFIAVDEAYCIAYAELYGGVADGTQTRPNMQTSLSVIDYAMYSDGETYEGTRYLYGDLIDGIDGLADDVDYYETAVAKYRENLASILVLEDAYENYDDAQADYNEALDTYYAALDNYNDLDDEIAAKEQLASDLAYVQTTLEVTGPPYRLAISYIEQQIETYTGLVEDAEEALA